MKNKIEINILFFILSEALFLLFFIDYSILNIIVGTILGILLIIISKKINSKILSYIYHIILIPLAIICFYNIIYKLCLFKKLFFNSNWDIIFNNISIFSKQKILYIY